MVLRYCLGMIASVSTLIILSGAATPSSVVNFSIEPVLEPAGAPSHGGSRHGGQELPAPAAPRRRVYAPLRCAMRGTGARRGTSGAPVTWVYCPHKSLQRCASRADSTGEKRDNAR